MSDRSDRGASGPADRDRDVAVRNHDPVDRGRGFFTAGAREGHTW